MKIFSYHQPFIVVGGFIVRDGKLLLIQENHPPDVGKWNLPAGKLNFGEDPILAAIREVREESGLDFTPTALLGIHSVHRQDVSGGDQAGHEVHVLRIVFSGAASGEVWTAGGEVVDGREEISGYKWVPLEDVAMIPNAELRYHDIKQLAVDYQAGVQYPLGLMKHLIQRAQ